MVWYVKGEAHLEPKNKEEFLDLVLEYMGDDARYYVQHQLLERESVLKVLRDADDTLPAVKALDLVYDKLLDME